MVTVDPNNYDVHTEEFFSDFIDFFPIRDILLI